MSDNLLILSLCDVIIVEMFSDNFLLVYMRLNPKLWLSSYSTAINISWIMELLISVNTMFYIFKELQKRPKMIIPCFHAMQHSITCKHFIE